MSIQINDGTGKGNLVKVDETNRMYVDAVSKTSGERATDDGYAFNINTGFITLTSDSTSAVMYLKNTSSIRDVHITAIALGFHASTGGSATDLNDIVVIRNPTGGTIISNEVDVDMNSNRNYGSSFSLSSMAYKGVEGDTITGGNDHILFIQGAKGRLFAGVDEILPAGTSIGITVTPPSGNTSMQMYCALILHTEAAE